jgi:O-succinylbenzoic acid--CoA ligase
VGGLAIIFRILLGGGAVVLPEETEALEDRIIGPEVTHLSLVPTQLLQLLQNNKISENLKGLKAILLGGSPIPANLIRKAVNIKLPIFISYGSTEMASQITTTRAGDSLQQLLTAGRPLKYRHLKIAADQEILVGGEPLFQGFLVKGSIQKNRDKEGWYHSGDLGFLDKKGYLKVTGRKDNMFVSGGENIQPEEVEQALHQMDGIEEVVVVSVPDEKFGHRPVAFVKMKGGKKFKIKDFEIHLERILPNFKIPDHFFPWPKDRLRQKGLKISREKFKRIAEKMI